MSSGYGLSPTQIRRQYRIENPYEALGEPDGFSSNSHTSWDTWNRRTIEAYAKSHPEVMRKGVFLNSDQDNFTSETLAKRFTADMDSFLLEALKTLKPSGWKWNCITKFKTWNFEEVKTLMESEEFQRRMTIKMLLTVAD